VTPDDPDETVNWPGSTPDHGDDAERTVAFGHTPPASTPPPVPPAPQGPPAPAVPPQPPVPPPGPAMAPPPFPPAAPPFPPGGGWPPAGGPAPGYQPPQPPGRRNPQWWLLGAAAGIIVVLVVVLAVVLTRDGGSNQPAQAGPAATSTPSAAETSSAAPPSTTPRADDNARNVAPENLERYLLTPAEAGERFAGRKPEMKASKVETELVASGNVDPQRCASAYGPVLEGPYRDSGYTGIAANVLSETPDPDRQVIQAVVSFPDKAAAKAFFDEQMEAWQDCKLTKITYGPDSPGIMAGHTDITDGVAGLLLIPDAVPGKPNKTCQRGMAVRENVVVDVRACSQGETNVANSGWSIANAIAKKIG